MPRYGAVCQPRLKVLAVAGLRLVDRYIENIFHWTHWSSSILANFIHITPIEASSKVYMIVSIYLIGCIIAEDKVNSHCGMAAVHVLLHDYSLDRFSKYLFQCIIIRHGYLITFLKGRRDSGRAGSALTFAISVIFLHK